MTLCHFTGQHAAGTEMAFISQSGIRSIASTAKREHSRYLASRQTITAFTTAVPRTPLDTPAAASTSPSTLLVSERGFYWEIFFRWCLLTQGYVFSVVSCSKDWGQNECRYWYYGILHSKANLLGGTFTSSEHVCGTPHKLSLSVCMK